MPSPLSALLRAGRRAAGQACRALIAEGPVRRIAAARGVQGLILNYHTPSARQLEAQLDQLAPAFELTSVDEALARASKPVASARPALALTFDDGKRCQWTELAPVLEARGVRGAFFVTTEPAKSGGLHWFDLAERVKQALDPSWRAGGRAAAGGPEARLDALAKHLGRPPGEARNLRVLKHLPGAERAALLEELASALGVSSAAANDEERSLTPEEVARLDEHHTVGSHTRTHPILTREDAAFARTELETSRRELEAWVGHPISQFAYPNGNASDATEALTRGAGYEIAWTTVPRWLGHGPNLHRLPRIQLFGSYDAADVALKVVLGAFGGLPNPDGTGFAYHRS